MLAACLSLAMTSGYWGLPYDATWDDAAAWGWIPADRIQNGAWWGLITPVFIHPEQPQLLFALLWLAAVGARFELTYGSLRWLAFFLSAAFVSAGIALGADAEGHGTTGVGYAFFGFAWVARRQVRAFRGVVNRWLIAGFLGWLLISAGVFISRGFLGDLAAPVGGLLYGAAVAVVFVHRRLLAGIPAVAALLAAAVLPLFWCPWSPGWTALQAWKAHEKKEHGPAIQWYRRSLALGYDATWVWQGLTEIYGERRDEQGYAEALRKLHRVDPQASDTAVRSYGKPGRWDDRVPHWIGEEPAPGVPEQ